MDMGDLSILGDNNYIWGGSSNIKTQRIVVKEVQYDERLHSVRWDDYQPKCGA